MRCRRGPPYEIRNGGNAALWLRRGGSRSSSAMDSEAACTTAVGRDARLVVGVFLG